VVVKEGNGQAAAGDHFSGGDVARHRYTLGDGQGD